MAIKPQSSFSSGELDPRLHDKVTLERFQNALATARNVLVGKAATIMSRFGRFFFKESIAKTNPIKIFSPPNSSIFYEVGIDVDTDTDYIAIYDFSGALLHREDIISPGLFTKDILDNIHFVPSGEYVYIFSPPGAYFTLKLQNVSPYLFESSTEVFDLPQPPGSPSATYTIGGTGYNVDYAFTTVVSGQETFPRYFLYSGGTPYKKPVNVGEKNDFVFRVSTTYSADELATYDEIRIYQRPTEGSAYGFLGRSTNIYDDAGVIRAKFTDLGQTPDYGNGIPTLVTREGLSNKFDVGLHLIKTATVYQQRLILGNFIDFDKEAVVASRPGYQNNFYRDFPYSADSALNFKAGTSGTAEVLRMIEKDGLVVFTTAGVFVSGGILSPDNTALERRGSWVIDEKIAPLVIPGGLFFVDKTTSTVRQLIYSQEIGSYDSVDQSIFSDHLFESRTITSWAYQEGTVPMIIVTFSDGTFATFTYSNEHQLRAWTRHDSTYPVEQVEGTGIADTTIFVINKNGTRYIEFTIPRSIPSTVAAVNPEASYLAYGAYMDSLTVKVDLLNDDLVGTDEFILVPLVADEWDGDLTLTCGTSALFTNPGPGAVGEVHRFFHPIEKYVVDLEVISRTNNNSIVVRPSETFPETYAEGFRLYLTHELVENLDYLDDEEVSVICDGNVASSPYNDNAEDTFNILSVVAGELGLPERSAITIVGRPIVGDIKTLNITTVEQSPTVIESLTVNKLYIRVYKSRGLFVDNYFPEEKVGEFDGNSVKDMQTLEDQLIPSNVPFIANRAGQPKSRRIERTLPGEWDSNGRISIRQVDPLHFEILSIIADVEILRRSDR